MVLSFLGIVFIVALFLAAVWGGADQRLRPVPERESLLEFSGILQSVPGADCYREEEWEDFDARLQTTTGTQEMMVPCGDGVDRRASGEMLTVRYAQGTDFFGRAYREAWEVRTPSHVYVDFARRKKDVDEGRWRGALGVFCGSFGVWWAVRRMVRAFARQPGSRSSRAPQA